MSKAEKNFKMLEEIFATKLKILRLTTGRRRWRLVFPLPSFSSY